MKKGLRVSGSKEIAEAMRKFAAAEVQSVRKGVQKASLFLKGEAVQLAPIHYGPLRGSAFYSTDIFKGRVRGRVGFTAEYAPYVHEAPMKLDGQSRPKNGGTYWQGGENKFLQKAAGRNSKQIIDIIAKEAKF